MQYNNIKFNNLLFYNKKRKACLSAQDTYKTWVKYFYAGSEDWGIVLGCDKIENKKVWPLKTYPSLEILCVIYSVLMDMSL